jgi:PAS domain S-box-containing protein
MKVLPEEIGYLFENIFFQLPSPVVITDTKFQILQTNQAMADKTKRRLEDLQCQDLVKILRPAQPEEERIRQFWLSTSNENKTLTIESYISTGVDTGIWINAEGRSINYAGQTLYLFVLNDSVKNQNRQGDSASDGPESSNSNDLILSIFPDGSLSHINVKMRDILGFSDHNYTYLHITDILREEQIPYFFKMLDRIRLGEKFELIETIFKTQDGRPIYVEGNMNGHFEYGNFLSTRCIFRDISYIKALEETYSQLVHNFPVSIYIVQNGHFRFVNPSFASLTGYSERELIGKDALFLVHPDDSIVVQKTALRLLKSNKSIDYEFRLIRKTGEVRWVMETIVSISFEGQPALLGTMIDLTERKMVEGALQESKDRYQTLFNSASDAIIIHDLSGHLLEVNDAACQTLKYTRTELLKMNLAEIKTPKCVASLPEKTKILLESGHLKIESENIASDGRVIPVEINGVVIEYENKKAILNVARDISERKQAETARKLNQARMESQLKITEFKGTNSQDLLYFALDEIIKLTGSKLGFIYYYDHSSCRFSLDSWSKDVMLLSKNRPGFVRFGLDQAGLLGNVVKLQKPVLTNTPQEPSILENGFPEGAYKLDNYMSVPVIMAKETVAIVGMANKPGNYELTDVRQIELFMTSIWNTLERCKTEEALRTSEQRYRQLVECSQDGILEIDENGSVLMANPSACKILGYMEDELIGVDFSETCLPEERYSAHQRLMQLKSKVVLHFERLAVRKNGQQFPIDVLISPLSQGHFQEVFRDITERKKMEHELQENEQKYRLLVENQTDLVVEFSTDDKFLFVNPAFCKLIGKTREDLVGTRSFEIIHPDDIADVIRVNQSVFKPPYSAYSEHRVHTLNGWRWVAWTSNAVMDNAGTISAFTCMGRDITESKQAKDELEKANARLRELDKLKDNFLSTVSHELRTPLTSIKSFVEILLNYDEDQSTQREFLGIINEESDRLTRLINDFLDISKIQAGRLQWKNEEFSLAEVVNSAVHTAKPLIEKNQLRMTVEMEPNLPKIMFDKDRLVQVFTNLIGNAVKFTPEGGQITLKVKINGDKPGYLTVSITDTGIGIASENHARIFENFGQVGDVLKDRPKGTGLGLPISKKIIENFSGKIWVESQLGQGTTFFFTVPIAPSKNQSVLEP